MKAAPSSRPPATFCAKVRWTDSVGGGPIRREAGPVTPINCDVVTDCCASIPDWLLLLGETDTVSDTAARLRIKGRATTYDLVQAATPAWMAEHITELTRGTSMGLAMIVNHLRGTLAVATALCLAAIPLAAPAQAASSCKLVKVAAIPLEMDGNRLLAAVTINGKPAHLMVDTGAWMTMLSRSSMSYLGLKAIDAQGKLIGVDGTSRLLQTTMDSLELGTWRGTDLRVYVGGYGGWSGDTVGFLGMDLLERYDMEFDLAHKLLSLYKPEKCENDVLAYWSDSYNVTDMESGRGTRSRIRLIVSVNGQPVHA
jgi:predicted aspartyl protease